MNGKIILSLAISLDGFIASTDGGFEWISGDGDNKLNTKDTHDFAKFLQGIDIVLMGADCYKQGFAKDYANKTVYVATTKKEDDQKNIKFISGDIVGLIQKEKEDGKNTFLFGGGVTIDPFIKADVIDEYHVAIIPTILGKGRKLFLDNNPTLPLHLQSYTINEGTPVFIYTRRK